MVNGYIKMYRTVLDNPVVCKDSEVFAVWCYLLLKATHDEYDVVFGSDRITLKKGQLITSRKSIASHFKINESKVERTLILLKNEQMIEQQSSSKNRLISILKWEDYQSSEQVNEQQVNNKWTTSEQQVNTNKNVKNIKNVKNVKNNTFIKPSIDDIRAYIDDEALLVDPNKFYDYYESNGWKIGGKALMKDWQATLRNWDRNNDKPKPKEKNVKSGSRAMDMLVEDHNG